MGRCSRLRHEFGHLCHTLGYPSEHRDGCPDDVQLAVGGIEPSSAVVILAPAVDKQLVALLTKDPLLAEISRTGGVGEATRFVRRPLRSIPIGGMELDADH